MITTGAWTARRVTDADISPIPTWEELTPAEQMRWVGDAEELLPAMARIWWPLSAWVSKSVLGVHIKRTPAATSLAMLEHTLPWGKGQTRPYAYPTLSEGLGRLIAATSPVHRMELLAAPGALLSTLATYDARLAYAAHTRHLPTLPEGGAIYDDLPDYEPHRPGRYLARITVPSGWDRLGLAPRPAKGRGWEWPSTPGETWEQWLDECEVRLLLEHGWPFAVRKRLLFAAQGTPGNDPTRTWHELLCAKIEEIDAKPPSDTMRASRAAVRAMLLHPVGHWHKQTNARELTGIGADELELLELTDRHVMTGAAPGTWDVKGRGQLTAYQSRWRRVEWSAAIYARERVAVTRAALQRLRDGDTLAAIDADALLVLNGTGPLAEDTGRVGCYRRKEWATFVTRASLPGTLSELRRLAKAGTHGA